MAKSESTAVNALIDMVRSGKPAGADAGDDLFAQHPPRMTSTIPPTAAEVAPLPRNRAPTGTSQHVVDKQVRMTTAPPRTNTIPPLPQAAGKAPPLPHRASRPSPPPRSSQQAAPPPRPTQPPVPRPSGASRVAQQMPAVRASQQMPAVRASQQMPAVRADAQRPRTEAAERPRTGTHDAQRSRAASPSPSRAGSPSPELLAAAAAQKLPRAKSPELARKSGAQRAASPDLARAATTDVARAATLPAPKRKSGPQRATGAQRTTPPRTSPVAAPFEAPHPMLALAQQQRMSTIDQTGDAVSAENWFEVSRAVDKVDETWVGSRTGERRASGAATARKVLVPLVALAVVGFGVGYLVFHSAAAHKKSGPRTAHVTAPVAAPAPTPEQVAIARPSTESPNAATATAGGTQPEPPPPSAAPVAPNPSTSEATIADHAETPAPVAPAAVQAVAQGSPVVEEVHTAHGVVKLVDVRIDSKPAGATVMLVDNGRTTLLGTTPVAASVDPSRSYDVVLSLEGRPTQMTHLDPTKTQRIDVTLAKSAPVAKASPAVKAAPAPHHETPHHAAKKVASAPAGGLADPGFEAPKAEVPKADRSEGGNGTLMVSSKPPCNIWIDGNDTGLVTPQRSISLGAGTHKVTFVNAAHNITKTVAVKISADQSTKLIQDLMPH
jgi:hypothetical protein